MRLSQERAEQIARAYFDHNENKPKALLAIGYKETYATRLGKKLFEKSEVIAEINKLRALAVEKTLFTIKTAEAEYEEARSLARKMDQPSAMVAATTGKARLYGMDRDAGARAGEDVIPDLTPEVIEQLKQLASDRIELQRREKAIKIHREA